MDIKHLIKWNYYYNKIWKYVSWWYDKIDLHILDFVNNYNINFWDNVLDVWCWYWKNTLIFLERWMYYTWIDISKIAIYDAKNKYKSWTFILWDFLDYDFKYLRYSFIIDAWCIHVNHPDKINLFLEKYYNLLENNGKLFIRIFKSLIDTKEPLFYVDKLLPVWGYTEEKIKIHIYKNNFVIDKFILDEDYYTEDDVFYLYLIKKKT